MQKVALALYKYIHRKYIVSQQRKSDELYTRQIEFEMGEAVNLKGIPSRELYNKIRTQISYAELFIGYASRPGNWIFILINIICLSIVDLSQEDFSVFYQFVIPLIAGILMYLVKMLCYQMVKFRQDESINKRRVTIFRKLKKIVAAKKPLEEKQYQQSAYQPNDIVLFSSQRKQEVYKPMIISSFKDDKKVVSTPLPQIGQQIEIFETVLWEDVEVGDIIVLQRNELCPADVLVLESNYDHCYADVTNFSGNTNQIFKSPHPLTGMPRMHQFKSNCFEYRILLSGKVNYDRNTEDKSLYSGFVRLKNDPQAIDIKKENILFREQQLENCDYVYGLVLYTGMSCRYYYNIPKTKVNNSFFHQKVDRFFQFTLILLIVLSFASWMIESLRFMNYGRKWSFEVLCSYLLGYLNMIPYYLHCLLDFKTVITMLIKQMQFTKQRISTNDFDSKTPFILQSFYQRINDTPLADLCLIDSVIFDKTGTMTIPKFKLKTIFMNEQMFVIKNKTFAHHTEWKFYKQQQQDFYDIQQSLKQESQSPAKQASQVRISKSPKIMIRSTKKNSLKLQTKEDGIGNSNQENSETNNYEQLNVDPDIEDNVQHQEVHHSKQPKLFQNSWGSNTDINNQNQNGTGSHNFSPQQPADQKRQTQISSLRRKQSVKLDRGGDKQKKFTMERSQVFTKFLEEIKSNNNEEIVSYTEKDFANRLINAESRRQTQEALFPLLICHNTLSQYNRQEDYLKQEFSCRIDELQLEFCSQYDYKFVCTASSRSKYIVEINGNLQEIPVTVTQLEHYKLSVILQKVDYLRFFEDNDQQFDYVQFIRDDSQEMSNQILMNKDDREKWDSMIYRMYQHGCRPVVFFQSFLDTFQYKSFIQNPIQEMKTQPRAYELLLVIGISEKIRKSVGTVVKSFVAADMLVWIASGDTLEKVLPIAYKTEILKDIIPIIHFDQQDINLQVKQQILWLYNNQIKQLKDEQLFDRRPSDRTGSPSSKRKSIHSNSRRFSTKGLLPGFQNNQQKIKPFSILIHGQTLEKIEKDRKLFNHLAFIIAFSSSVVGYRMSTFQKGILVKILQEKQVWRRRILVIGDEINDSKIMALSDFAIQLQGERQFETIKVEKMEHLMRTKKESKSQKIYKKTYLVEKHQYKEQPFIGTTDIVVKNFTNLMSLVFNESRQSAELLENLITFSFYRSYLLCFSLFFQNLFSGFTIYPPLDYFQSVLYIIPCLLLYIQRIKQKTQPIKSINNQLIYFHNQNSLDFRQMRYWLFFYKVILYSAFEALLISIALSYSQYFSNSGQSFDTQMSSIQQFILIQLLDLTKLLTHADTLQMIVLPVVYFSFSTIGYMDEFRFNFDELFQYLLSAQSILLIIAIQLTFFCFQKTLTQFHSIYVNDELFSVEDQIEISQEMKPIQIYYSKRRKDNLVIAIQKYVLKLFKNEDEIDPIIGQMLSGLVLIGKTTKINKITQSFKNTQLETKFQLNELPSIIEYYRLYYPLSWMLVEGAILVQIWLINTDVDYTWFLYFTFGYNAAQVLMALFIYTVAFKKYHFRISKILITSRMIYKIIYDAYFYQDNNNQLTDMLIMQLFMLQPLIDDRPLTIILYCFVINISFIARFSANNTTDDVNFNNYIMLNYYLIAFMQTALSSGMHLRAQRNLREDFIQMLTLAQQTNSISDTLSILMPRFIRNMINQKGEFDIEENQGEVAILFCDICQFDTIIKTEKENVIHLLDILFRQYDSLCSQYGLQKIETVGKTYMAAAGLKNIATSDNVNPVLKSIQVAFEMRKFAQQQHFGTSGDVIVKIGVHYGNVIAGVIGYHKPQFSLIGDTVNTTSRVCSTGQDGQIKISEEAFRLVSGSLDFTFQKDFVEAKGKGKLETYIVQEQKQSQRSKGKNPINKRMSRNSVQCVDSINRQTKERKITRKPTLILPHIKQNNPKLQHKSSLNVEHNNAQHSHGDSDHANPPRGTIEGGNLIETLELKLQKENLLIDESLDFPSSRIDKDKLKQLHIGEEEFKETDVLVLHKSKLYLDFHPDVDKQWIDEFYSNLTKQNTCLVLSLKAGVAILLLVQNTSTILIASIFENQLTWVVNLTFGYIIFVIKILFLILLISKKYRKKVFKEQYFTLSYIITLIWWIIHIFSYDTFVVGEICIAIGIFLSFMTQLNPIIKMKSKVIESVLMISINVIVVLTKNWEKALIYYALILQIIFITNQIYKFHKNVQLFNNKLKLKAKHSQLDQLVKHQLPSHMLEQFLKLQQQRAVLKDSHDNVTLLFADIAGFTEYSSKVSPEQVVFMLRNLFTEFDKCCQEKLVYKLYTIGDCYVVMGMLDAKDRKPALEAKNTVELGFEMINIIKRVRDHINFQGLDMRIGIHTGSIIGGVLGTEIVRYDIYGPDVLIANKMESKGDKGKLQVSSSTKELLEQYYPEEFKYTFHATVDIPSIERSTDGYFINFKTYDEPSMDIQEEEGSACI